MNTKICTLSPEHVPVMEIILNSHNVPFKLEPFIGQGGQSGVRVFIPGRLRLFFTEMVMPEYKELTRTSSKRNVDYGKEFEETLSKMFNQAEHV